jgi:ABC-type phosphate/phosphonate transport system substrate-binding protein
MWRVSFSTGLVFLWKDDVNNNQFHSPHKRVIFPTVILAVLLFVVGCQSLNSAETGSTTIVTRPVEIEVTREVYATVQVPVELTRQVFIPVTETPIPLGAVERPIRLVLAPSAEPAALAARGAAIQRVVEDATGKLFEVVTPLTYAEFFVAACAEPERTVVFMPALAYPTAHDKCGLQPQFTGLHDELPWSASMIVVAREGGDIQTIEELNDRVWGVADADDLVNSLYFKALFAEQGIEIATVNEYGADTTTLIAFADESDELDFVTAPFMPPILPYDERPWRYGQDDPELWREVSNFPRRSGQGFVVISGYVEDGGYRVRDARSAVLDTAGRIFIDTTILLLSAQIPNDVIAMGSAVSLGLATEIGDVLSALGDSAECPQSLCAGDFYQWDGIAPVDDAAFAPVRYVIDQLELDEEAVINYLEAAPQ